MKKLVFLIMLLVVGAGFAFAQKEDEAKVEKRVQEVREYKMKYLAQEMELTEAQKKKFFEVYNEMSQKKWLCYKDAMKLERKVKHDKNASEADYQKLSEAINKANASWADSEKVYNDKFSEFLSQKQIFKMREAENSFRAKFNEMKQNRKKDHGK